MIITLTKDNFAQEVDQATTPILVELWAGWCIYCRLLSPILNRLSKKLGQSLLIGKINIDKEPELAEQLDAKLVPTLYLYQNGSHGEKLVAPLSLTQVETWIQKQLKSEAN